MKKTSPEPLEEDKIPPPVPTEDSSSDGEATDDAGASWQGDLDRLVSIVDNFELGLSAAREERSPIYSGMNMVLKQLTDFLTENGLEPIDAVGKQFDPNLHEAIGHEPSDKVP